MIGFLCVVGYFVLGAITAGATAYFADENITSDDDFYVCLIFLWPIGLTLLAIAGFGFGLGALAMVIRGLIESFIKWLRSEKK